MLSTNWDIETLRAANDTDGLSRLLFDQEYLGREHFLVAGELTAKPTFHPASMAFGTLVTRVAFPRDTRYHDYRDNGLDVVMRDNVGMGTVPEFARIKSDLMSNTLTKYAVESVSLIDLVGKLENGDLKPSGKLGPTVLDFLIKFKDILITKA